MAEEKTSHEVAEEKRRAAQDELSRKQGSPENDRMIAALLRERAGLETQGKTERVKQVDEQLELRGYKPEEKADAKKQAPQGRSATPPKQTKD